jgi:putative membrane protein
MKIKTLGLACLFAMGAFTCARADVSSADKMFVKKAAQGGMLEVQLGQVAQDQAASPDVKNFGSMMVTDHGKANDELKSIVATKGITLAGSLDAKHQKMLDNLKAKSGQAFDEAYIAAMTKAHNADDALFQEEASSGSDPDLKAFAAKTDQDVIKKHIAMLQDMKSKMK